LDHMSSRPGSLCPAWLAGMQGLPCSGGVVTALATLEIKAVRPMQRPDQPPQIGRARFPG
ncbi:MAG: hypothetical protein L7T24_13330, partial [Luminiphilus sp.]|nr:hypothetical protein [Luminiphilus sp.]